jgi:histidinol phosphatase-like enzyme
VIFTNQKGISVGKTKEGDIMKKIEDIAADLDVEMNAIIAKQDD